MRKFLAGLAGSVLVLGSVGVLSAPALAVDSLGTYTIDCDAADIADESVTIVATAGVGDTFAITNSGGTDNCVIQATDLLTGEEVDGGQIPDVEGGVTSTSGAITIVNSGEFEIKSSGAGTPPCSS